MPSLLLSIFRSSHAEVFLVKGVMKTPLLKSYFGMDVLL